VPPVQVAPASVAAQEPAGPEPAEIEIVLPTSLDSDEPEPAPAPAPASPASGIAPAPAPVAAPAVAMRPAEAPPPTFGPSPQVPGFVDAPAPPAPVPPGREPSVQGERPELARVDAELLDQLLNYSGEVSIGRARLEQQIASIDFNLAELSRTVTRLKEQLRKLEIETESQILHTHEDEAGHRAEFDPLELDRYSTIQQYSRGLAETASDVASIQQLLETLTQDTQNLLQHQARTITELQNGLMRTRMVPFDSLVPSLRRTLRQAAQEVGKRAQLKVEGAQGEMDRNLLERMKAPFEHMLRNALAHGIEDPAARRDAGKSEEGSVVIQVSREATEVVIRVTDDGRGFNRDAIRKKAIERGLLKPDAQLSDRDLYAFVLETGFSTAEQVTQLAGRGVGMDVVNNEIKQLGGSLTIDSERGKGTVFTIRLPVEQA